MTSEETLIEIRDILKDIHTELRLLTNNRIEEYNLGEAERLNLSSKMNCMVLHADQSITVEGMEVIGPGKVKIGWRE